jgi:hypothetical protein
MISFAKHRNNSPYVKVLIELAVTKYEQVIAFTFIGIFSICLLV